MSDGSDLRQRILVALDVLLAPEGFKRRKRDFEWHHQESSELSTSLHLNFGRLGNPLAIHPSVSVTHAAVKRAVGALGVNEFSSAFWHPLSVVADGSYEARTSDGGRAAIQLIWADWCSAGRRFAEEAHDLNVMARDLQSEDIKRWPCASRSHRARLLPLVLRVLGRENEALALLPQLQSEIQGRDQLIPPYDAFAAAFRRANAAASA